MTTKEGRSQYKSNPLRCASCPILASCTTSKEHRKILERPIWALHVEEANHLRHQSDMKQIYARRNETIVRVFADAKEEHGMCWTTLRGIKKYFLKKDCKQTQFFEFVSSLKLPCEGSFSRLEL